MPRGSAGEVSVATTREEGVIIIAIDPGINGAIVLMSDVSQTIEIYDMPTVPKSVGKGRQVCASGVRDIIGVDHLKGTERGRKVYEHPSAIVELVGPTPQMGVTSAFAFGKTAGIIEGVLAALQIGVVYVRPQAWKKRFGLIKKEKDASRTKAIELYPQLARQLSRKKDADRAEALLLAHFASRLMDRELRRTDTAGSKFARGTIAQRVSAGRAAACHK